MIMVPVKTIWVNYAYIGMDEGWPANEKPGTLIASMSHGYVIKISQTHCRPASADEVAAWSGPKSPAWFSPKC